MSTEQKTITTLEEAAEAYAERMNQFAKDNYGSGITKAIRQEFIEEFITTLNQPEAEAFYRSKFESEVKSSVSVKEMRECASKYAESQCNNPAYANHNTIEYAKKDFIEGANWMRQKLSEPLPPAPKK